ncbi:MAG: YabP/YqfC family sporulation protein [Clostridiales bacterium]|nr:MAG: YabP/YqfC family sporulation protein [Clostridiales bacterium]
MFFSDEEIRFKVKSRILSVSGKNLSLVETSERDAVISGIVEKVDYV